MTLTLPDAKSVKSVAILCHRHADADTYLSAYALSSTVKTLMPQAEVSIIIPDGMSTLTRQLAKEFPYEERPERPDYDLIFAVDIAHIELLKDWAAKLTRSKGVKILIDHHPPQGAEVYDQAVVDTTASSAAEVVFGITKQLGVKPAKDVAQAILLAILFDSQNLTIAGPKSLAVVLELIEAGADLDRARAALRSPPDYSEVIARLKAARRAKVYRASGWVIAVSTVGSFQANVARGLTQLGADVAFVVGESGGELKGSLRAHQRFHEQTKVHLGTDIAEPISRGRGFGGGHPTAASFTCTSGDEPSLTDDFLKLMGLLLNEKPAEIT